MSKETLTPWTIDEYFNEITIRDNNKDFVLNMRLTIDAKKKRNNAQLILKAVNNHDRLVDLLYEANNQARRLLNRHDSDNVTEMEKVNNRAKYLSETFGNNDEPKIIQS